MKVLFIGGTGEISASCVDLAIQRGWQVSIFNRGKREEIVPGGVRRILGDLMDDNVYGSLAKEHFDVICQFIAYEPQTVQRDIQIFAGHCGQYIFISSVSAYEKPPRRFVITEDVPLNNPYWKYSQKKAEMEQILFQAYADKKFPVTVVRPGHTHRTRFPGGMLNGDEWAWRMIQGKPIILHGDGTTLWTLTYSTDFAKPFVNLLGQASAIGEAFHITRHMESYTWREIYTAMGNALGVEPKFVCVPTEVLVRYCEDWIGPIMGERMWSVMFDNSKVMRVAGPFVCDVSLEEGMRRAAIYFRERQHSFSPDLAKHALLDQIVQDIQSLGPSSCGFKNERC